MFLLDANVLMAAADDIYPEDVVPGFWPTILQMFNEGEAGIPVSVYRELVFQEGRPLTSWLAKHVPSSSAAVIQEDDSQVAALGRITNWLNDPSRSYSANHIQNFLSGADPRQIAAAITRSDTIVTYEIFVSDPNVRKAKIPNVAQNFGIECIVPIEMFRRSQRSF